ncbi:MAG: hypothetical protein KAU21_12375 [Gammaproteobacteria bacterium]|nr:hypothetical protein [Gammaproteobacteria bacterium]
MKKIFLITLFFLLQACDRDLNLQTASLTINNMTDQRIAPQKPLSIWSLYITPTNSLTPAIDRSVDLLASVALEPDTTGSGLGNSKTFTIDTCGQQLDIQVIFSDGSEQVFTTAAVVDCDTTFIQDVL